ncbi:MAG: hypothetical protein FJW90_08205 [Actinobacteria bacterium]|nr:hypothetical protein [Actinomycetota bacterium]
MSSLTLPGEFQPPAIGVWPFGQVAVAVPVVPPLPFTFTVVWAALTGPEGCSGPGPSSPRLRLRAGEASTLRRM